MIHDEVENESMEIDQELIQILELPNKDIETRKKKKMQTKLLEMKTTMCKMENTLEEVDSK